MPASGTTRLVAAAVLLLMAVVMHGFGHAEVRIDFSAFKSELEQRFGAERVPVVNELEYMLEGIEELAPRDRAEQINAFFNRHIRYEEDERVWGRSDYWASPLEALGKGEGDCEDFAIAKYLLLRKAGIGNEKLRLIYVRARIGMGSQAHMVLGYYPEPNAEPLILDSLVRLIAPASLRPDLTPVFSFNSEGLWVGGQARPADRATERLSRWRDVLERTQEEGIRLLAPTGFNNDPKRQRE